MVTVTTVTDRRGAARDIRDAADETPTATGRWVVPATLLGGVLWIPYGVFEMLEPWGASKVYRDDSGYDVVIDALLYRVYTLPGSLALLLVAVGLLALCRHVTRSTGLTLRAARALGYVALALGGITQAGVAVGFDPLFTGPRLFGTVALAIGTLLVGMRLRREHGLSHLGTALVGLGLLGLFLFPLWPLVYAVELIPAWLGAALIGLFGLGWVVVGSWLLRCQCVVPARNTDSPASRSACFPDRRRHANREQ